MAYWLTQHSVNSKNMVEHRVKHDKRHVELFFIELFKPCLDVVFELFLANADIVLVQISSEVNWPFQCFSVVNSWEPLLGNCVNRSVTPVFFTLVHKTIFIESQAFVDKESDELLWLLNGFEGLVNSILPSSELSGRVDVVSLLVRSEVFLRLGVEIYHGLS